LRLAALIVKELKQLRRDVRSLTLVVAMPMLVMILFGWGYGGGVGHVPIAVANLDPRSQLSWEVVGFIEQSAAFQVEAYPSSLEEARRLVEAGKAMGALVIPEGFTQNYLAGSAFLILLTDESSPSVASALRDSASALLAYIDSSLSSTLGLPGPRLHLIPSTVYGPQLKRVDAFMPVVLGIILFLLPTSLVSVAIAREREKGTLEALIASPLRRWEVVAGKLLAYGLVTFIDLLLALAVAIVGFKVLMRCHLLDLLAASTLFMVGSLGLGLAASAVSRNQLQAFQVAVFIFVPALLFCGAFAPVEVLSPSSRVVAYLNPLHYFVRALRGLMVRGAPLYMVLPDLTPLLIYASSTLTASLALFKARVE